MLADIDWLKNQDETFCLMKIQFCFIKTASVFCFISSHEKISNSVSFHENKIWFCFISLKKNPVLFHLTKKNPILSHFIKKNWFCLISQKKILSHSDSDDLKWVKKDKVVIISHYHFLCKSESGNSVSSQFCSVSFYQIEVWFCFISWKMNLILSHFTEKKFDLISLRLLSSSVSSHLMKKNSVLFHLMKIKSDSVSFHWKKISFCPDSDLGQNWIRTENSDSCNQSILNQFWIFQSFLLKLFKISCWVFWFLQKFYIRNANNFLLFWNNF